MKESIGAGYQNVLIPVIVKIAPGGISVNPVEGNRATTEIAVAIIPRSNTEGNVKTIIQLSASPHQIEVSVIVIIRPGGGTEEDVT